jgi:hypothetical protein
METSSKETNMGEFTSHGAEYWKVKYFISIDYSSNIQLLNSKNKVVWHLLH